MGEAGIMAPTQGLLMETANNRPCGHREELPDAGMGALPWQLLGCCSLGGPAVRGSRGPLLAQSQVYPSLSSSRCWLLGLWDPPCCPSAQLRPYPAQPAGTPTGGSFPPRGPLPVCLTLVKSR